MNKDPQYHICIFAGTTEGRKLAEFLSRQPIKTTVCVATEYGGELIPAQKGLEVLTGQMLPDEIVRLFRERKFDLVIDATHPYAASITKSVREACTQCGILCHRLGRSESVRVDSSGQSIVCEVGSASGERTGSAEKIAGREQTGGAESSVSDGCPTKMAAEIYVEDAAAAADYLKETTGSILLTTGSKELHLFTGIPGFKERVYARVLPLESSLESCRKAGLPVSHIIAMQGPFSEELNLTMLKEVSAEWLVTKDGGEPGGFAEKAQAARKAGAGLVVIGRPLQSGGASYGETIRMLCENYGCKAAPEIAIIGTGPGRRGFLTEEARAAIKNAECLIGAERMVKEHKSPWQASCEAISPEKIVAYIRQHAEYQKYAVLMSGDVGFYSGAKKLLPLLEDYDVKVVPGISSLVYLCSRLGQSYEDVIPVSLHGRTVDIAAEVRAHGRVFVLVGGAEGMKELCHTLVENGLGDVQMSIGERLSYADERITKGIARELAEGTYDPLSAALIENGPAAQDTGGENADTVPVSCHYTESRPAADDLLYATDAPIFSSEGTGTPEPPKDEMPHGIDSACGGIVTPGLPDEAFIRGTGEKGIIPMTKSEVRAVCLSKLQLTEDAVCWDIGSGTGSVAIEMAKLAVKGRVYAIEKDEDSVGLIRENIARFRLENVAVVPGTAPQALKDLPDPTHVFIGGSGREMRQILSCVLRKNPRTRIVATAIALETVAELTACCRDFSFRETQAVAVTVARDRKAGNWHLMTGQNPVYIFTLQG